MTFEDITNTNANQSNRFNQIEHRGNNLRLEGKGVECDSIMCGGCAPNDRNNNTQRIKINSHRANHSEGSGSSSHSDNIIHQ